MLISERELQLSFSAIAITYVWAFTIDGTRLHASIRKFPASSPRLLRIAAKWTLRRRVVRAAERVCYKDGTTFRGRLYPIYAKELAGQVTPSEPT